MPENVDLRQLLTVPPAEAIAVLRDKGYVVSWDWWNTWQDKHHEAHIAARNMKLQVLDAVQAEVNETLTGNLAEAGFGARVSSRLQGLGLSSSAAGLDSARLQLIFRQSVQNAYNEARWKDIQDNINERPYLQYRTMRDNAVRFTHRQFEGKVFRADDPIIDIIYPPNGFNCRCRMKSLSERQIRRQNLTVESGQSGIIESNVTLGSTTRRIRGYRDPQTQESLFIDPGFDTNIGRRALRPVDPLPVIDPAIRTLAQRNPNPWTNIGNTLGSTILSGVLLGLLTASLGDLAATLPFAEEHTCDD